MSIKGLLVLLLSLTLLSSCSSLKERVIPKEIIVKTQTVPVEIYQPPLPREVKLRDVDSGMFVINKENMADKIEEIETLLGGEFVIFAFVPASYENMSWNLQEMRRYMNQMKEIVIYYRKATEVTKDVDGDGDVDIDDWWLENQRLREESLTPTD